ncbi:Vacuolar sorting protein 9, partial [Globisporangium splendens]
MLLGEFSSLRGTCRYKHRQSLWQLLELLHLHKSESRRVRRRPLPASSHAASAFAGACAGVRGVGRSTGADVREMAKSCVAVLQPSAFMDSGVDDGELGRRVNCADIIRPTDAIPILSSSAAHGEAALSVSGNGDLLIAFAAPEEKIVTTEVVQLDSNVLSQRDELTSDVDAGPRSNSASGRHDNVSSSDSATGAVGTKKHALVQSFVARMKHGLHFRRNINAKIASTQLELKAMQLLMNGYQADLRCVIDQLTKDALGLEQRTNDTQQALQVNLSRLILNGYPHALADSYRCLQLLHLQELKLLKTQTELRQTILQTRVAECDWMCKSASENYQQRLKLLTAQLQSGGCDASSKLIAICEEEQLQLSPDDPFFASVDHLYQSHAYSKQLDLQLRSIAVLLATMGAKVENLAREAGECSERVSSLLTVPTTSLVKRTSFKDTGTGDLSATATTAKRSELHKIVECVAMLMKGNCGGGVLDQVMEGDDAMYHDNLNAFDRFVSDTRTRAGCLLHAFTKKLTDDSMADARISRCHAPRSQTQLDHEEPINASRDERNLYISDFRSLESLAKKPPFRACNEMAVVDESCNSEDLPVIVAAIDTLALPPPIAIVAFARFIQKLVASEYDLNASGDEAVSSDTTSMGDSENADSTCDKALTLETCVHYLVFRRLSKICFAYEQSHYSGLDADSVSPLCQHLHWKHAKQAIQQIPLEALAFPHNVYQRIARYTNLHQSFLPRTLQAFKRAECEVTPRGVIRSVLTGFRMLHRELAHVLDGGGVDSNLNADVLIPSLVLMMSRLNSDDELDLLPRRLNLVKTFQTYLLSEGCEEAYYLTCLQAAIAFIQTHSLDPESTHEDLASTLKRCHDCQQVVHEIVIERCPSEPNMPAKGSQTANTRKTSNAALPPPASTCSDTPATLYVSDEDAIRDLTLWIANESSAECIPPNVVAHEVWIHDGSSTYDLRDVDADAHDHEAHATDLADLDLAVVRDPRIVLVVVAVVEVRGHRVTRHEHLERIHVGEETQLVDGGRDGVQHLVLERAEQDRAVVDVEIDETRVVLDHPLADVLVAQLGDRDDVAVLSHGRALHLLDEPQVEDIVQLRGEVHRVQQQVARELLEERCKFSGGGGARSN